MILTNVLRASRGEAMSFFQVGTINGTNTAATTIGLPSLILGPHVALGTSVATNVLQSESIFGANPISGNGYVGNSATISGVTQFQVTPVETKEFYQGLLRIVEPRTLQLFVQQGIAREILFYLFTDKLIEDKGGVKKELRNDPLDPVFPEFQRYVKLAMQYGLSSERVPGGAGHDDKKSNMGGKWEPEKWQLCFNRLYKSPDVRSASNAPICGEGAVSADERTVSFRASDGTPVKLQVLPRSAFAIFQYLGRIVAAGEQGRITLFSTEAIDYPPLSDEFLFVVNMGVSGDCFLLVAFEAQEYCVPVGATNTKKILALLTQLIALNSSITDIPVTPTVRVLQ